MRLVIEKCYLYMYLISAILQLLFQGQLLFSQFYGKKYKNYLEIHHSYMYNCMSPHKYKTKKKRFYASYNL